MHLPFSQYVDLLDLHGRAAVTALGHLSPTQPVNANDDAGTRAREHWATLEIWHWILEHPDAPWHDRADPPAPPGYDDVVAAIADEVTELEGLLLRVGPDRAVDFFGQPGTSHDVARLLAHEVVAMAALASAPAGRQSPPLDPSAAADYVDRALHHWSEPEAGADWRPAPARLIATDAGATWHLRYGLEAPGDSGSIHLCQEAPPSVVVSGTAMAMTRWIEDLPCEGVQTDGSHEDVRALRLALGHHIEPEPKRRRTWWRR